tara:strand:+ start:725 stop:1156 length:432 start_codon:yes stop_codon:yes gene_type:complete
MANFIAEAISTTVGAIVSPIANIFSKKIDRKTAQDTIQGQIAVAKLDNQAQVSIQVADWDRLSKVNENETYKDEIVTYSLMSIFWLIIVGSVASAMGYTFGVPMLEGVGVAIAELNAVDGLVGELLRVIVYAAVSIKAVKQFI